MNFWKLIYKSASVALGVLMLIALAAVFWPKWKEYRNYEQRREEARRQIQEEEERYLHLKTQQERFRTDPRFVEQVAHDLGMAKTNEVLFKFKEDPSAPPR